MRLSVLDEGPGIAPADQAQVFERFFRVRGSEESTAEGAGLGLALAKLAIESNHGMIYFDPAQTQGALCNIEALAPSVP
jgi:signal transduction histidine kinase